jgi:hypothetical protein
MVVQLWAVAGVAFYQGAAPLLSTMEWSGSEKSVDAQVPSMACAMVKPPTTDKPPSQGITAPVI